MIEASVERSLLEVDGSCRDINFSEYISTAGAASLLDTIGARWKLAQATNTEGEAVRTSDFRTFLGNEKGSLSTQWKGPGSPSELQAFFHWTKPGQVFAELTFFPQDLDRQQFTLDGFLKTLASLVNAAQSQEYYVRFEDASWRHADGSAKPGVIFSHENMALPTS